MAWDIVYYEAPDGTVPAIEFLQRCPTKVAASLLAVLEAVADAPPPQYSGGGKWEAMHGAMRGYYEARVGGPGREQFRLFCLLENADTAHLHERGLSRPAIAVITGLSKRWQTTFNERNYRVVRDMGDRHKASFPRRIVE